MKKLAIVLALLAPLGCTTHHDAMVESAAAPALAHYHVVRHIPIGGEGGWDYLTADSSAHRLYVSHSDRVHVIDLDRGTVIGEIPNTQGVHGIAIASALHRGFISDGRTSTVTIFDLDTMKTIGEVKTGQRPDAILFDPISSRVFTFNAGDKNTTVIDAANGNVAGSIALGGKPEFAVADGRGHVFVNIEDTSEVADLDARSIQLVRRWPIAPCEEPSGLAIDRLHRRLFSVCDKVMAVSDPDAAKVVKTLTIGDGPDAAAFDAGSGLVFSSNGADGTLSVVRASGDEYTLVENAPSQRGARTMALDERTHHIYLATAMFGPAPAATTERPHPRPSIVPGSFEIIEMAP
jgi:DNA-binding beta-propeller fold protein YncE